MGRKYYITEVFSERSYGGNQLATVVDSQGLETEEMQKIARAFNFAETTFITGGSLEGGYDVRIFTPTDELPFAGHPTLGTSFLIRNVIDPSAGDQVVLNLGVGPIPVTFEESGVLWMRQNQPVFGKTVDSSRVAEELGLSESDIDPDHPCQFVSTGLEFLVIPLNSATALKQARPPEGAELSRTCLPVLPGRLHV